MGIAYETRRKQYESLRALGNPLAYMVEPYLRTFGAPSGLLDASPDLIATRLGVPTQKGRVKAALQAMHQAGIIVWDAEGLYAYVVGTTRDDPPREPKDASARKRFALSKPEGPARAKLLDELNEWTAKAQSGATKPAKASPPPPPAQLPLPAPSGQEQPQAAAPATHEAVVGATWAKVAAGARDQRDTEARKAAEARQHDELQAAAAPLLAAYAEALGEIAPLREVSLSVIAAAAKAWRNGPDPAKWAGYFAAVATVERDGTIIVKGSQQPITLQLLLDREVAGQVMAAAKRRGAAASNARSAP